ncbi:Exportin-7 [Schistosoma japonicum]|nr:Exportin-7 [Schistosoma japonicum]
MNHDSESDITRAIFLQRKRSSSFRDLLLLPIFRLGLNLLRDADQSFASLDLNNTEQHGLLSQCLQLVYACLSYDFIGTSGSVSSTVCDASPGGIDDLVVVQIPTSWRQIFLDSDTVPLFFRLYKNLSPDLSVFISSIRRSLFTNAERSIFLSQIVSGCRDILLSVNNATITSENTTTTVIGSPTNTSTNKHNTSSMNSQNCNLINNPESYHEFCLLLSRLKCNYQLNELVALSDYSSFIELLTVFTVNCLKGYTFESNQNSLYYLLALWQRLVASIPYVHPPDTHMLNNATPQIINAYIQKCLNSIPKYMNHTIVNQYFGTIGRCEYSKTCSIIIPLFDEYASSLEKAWNILTSNSISVNDLHLEQVLRLEEHRLAWLVYMVGALIGGRVSYANADEYDGELVCRVLQLNRLITNFITSITSSAVSNHANIMLTTQSPSMIRLELAVLSFFEQLRRVYVGENVGRLSKPEFFPFLLSTTTSAISQSSIISRLRTTFYASISRLLMVELGEDEEQFLNFVSPLTRVTNQLIITLLSGGSPNLSQELTRISIIGLARDIRGISCSLNNKSSYQMLLDWIYPNGLQLFNRALEIWSFDYTVTVPVLKTITELIHNRNGRLLFDATIPTGYLLFTYVSKLLCNFGLQLISNTCQLPKNSIYDVKLKPIMAALNLLKMCLGGGLINFGVYSMFHDDSLERAMEMGIQLLLSLTDNSSIIEVCCVCLDYFLTHLFKIVQREQRLTRTTSNNNNNNSLYLIDVNNTNLLNEDNHTTNNNNTTTTATTRNSSNNDQLLIPHLILGRGGASNHSVWSSRATSASSNLLNLLVSTTTSNSQSLEMNSSVNLLRRILIILLSSVIQENCRCQWSMCKPLLPLILLNQQYYTELKNRVITELPVERQESVTKLFTQNLSTFKHSLGDFIKKTSAKLDNDTISLTECTGQTECSNYESYVCLGSAIAQAGEQLLRI